MVWVQKSWWFGSKWTRFESCQGYFFACREARVNAGIFWKIEKGLNEFPISNHSKIVTIFYVVLGNTHWSTFLSMLYVVCSWFEFQYFICRCCCFLISFSNVIHESFVLNFPHQIIKSKNSKYFYINELNFDMSNFVIKKNFQKKILFNKKFFNEKNFNVLFFQNNYIQNVFQWKKFQCLKLDIKKYKVW